MAAYFLSSALTRRQDDLPSGYVEENGRVIHWWYSRDGRIVKWSLFLGFFFLLTAYLVGGYLHARSRVKKGLLPLRYHRWMIKRSQLAMIDPSYAYPSPRRPQYNTYRPADSYGMNAMPPPPMYDPTAARPPMYAPPEGGSKVDPAQGTAREQQQFEPPEGPPPQQSGIAASSTGSTNPFRR